MVMLAILWLNSVFFYFMAIVNEIAFFISLSAIHQFLLVDFIVSSLTELMYQFWQTFGGISCFVLFFSPHENQINTDILTM